MLCVCEWRCGHRLTVIPHPRYTHISIYTHVYVYVYLVIYISICITVATSPVTRYVYTPHYVCSNHVTTHSRTTDRTICMRSMLLDVRCDHVSCHRPRLAYTIHDAIGMCESILVNRTVVATYRPCETM